MSGKEYFEQINETLGKTHPGFRVDYEFFYADMPNKDNMDITHFDVFLIYKGKPVGMWWSAPFLGKIHPLSDAWCLDVLGRFSHKAISEISKYGAEGFIELMKHEAPRIPLVEWVTKH